MKNIAKFLREYWTALLATVLLLLADKLALRIPNVALSIVLQSTLAVLAFLVAGWCFRKAWRERKAR